jgi:uncharacterized protein (TIGR03437 family)
VAGPVEDLPLILRASNGQLVTPSNPVHRNDRIFIYLTGMGLTWPAVDTGSPSPLDPLAEVQIEPVVTLGGSELIIEHAALTPGLAGVYEIKARVPDYVPTGQNVPLAIVQGESSTVIPARVVQ